MAEGANPDRADTSARNNTMVKMRQAGATYAQIWAEHGLSASRVMDVVKKIEWEVKNKAK